MPISGVPSDLDLTIFKNCQIGLKTRKMAVFSKFQLWHLFPLYFSSHYHFRWFSGPFQPFFLKNGKKSEFHLFWLIFRKMAPAMPKWPSETPGMGQMASFGMVFNTKTYGRIFEKVFRESSKSHRQPILSFWLLFSKKWTLRSRKRSFL